MRAISVRLNENPEIARLIFVNPILALEDLDVELTAEVKQHIMDALRFPARIRERKADLEQKLGDAIAELGLQARLPLSPSTRWRLLFDKLELEPLEEDSETPGRLAVGRTAAYAEHHPVAAMLADYERVRRGVLVFQSKASYQAFKRGDKVHAWVERVTFDV
jgi:hypothetical protein